MSDPEATWVEDKTGTLWTARLHTESGASLYMMVKETKNVRLPFDVVVQGAVVGFKKTLEAAKACAVRQAKLRIEAEENAR